MIIHPAVKDSLDYADVVQEELMSAIDKISGHRSEALSKDRDIALKVDSSGMLTDLWLKPGILDRKTPSAIAAELTRLVTGAVTEAAQTAAEHYRQAHVRVAELQTHRAAAPTPADTHP